MMSSKGQSRNGASSGGLCPRQGGGSGKNGGNGGSSEEEESLDLEQVAQTIQEVSKELGDLAKTISKEASQDEDPYLRQKAVRKLRGILHQVVGGAGSVLDLACLLRCLNGVSEAAVH